MAPPRFVTKIPERIASEIAAPLLCAGITVMGAIKKTGLKKGQWLVLMGAGGGLGHLGTQIARKMGFKVIAVDTGDEKKKVCLELGAEKSLDFATEDVEKVVKDLTNGYGAHAVICLTGNVAAYTQALQLVRIMGTMVCVGLTLEQWTVSPFQLAIRGIKVVGTSVGTEEEMDELLAMVVAGDVVPKIEIFELEALGEVIKRIADGKMTGKAVIKLPA